MIKKQGEIIKEMNKEELVHYINSQPEDSVTTVYFTGGYENEKEIQ